MRLLNVSLWGGVKFFFTNIRKYWFLRIRRPWYLVWIVNWACLRIFESYMVISSLKVWIWAFQKQLFHSKRPKCASGKLSLSRGQAGSITQKLKIFVFAICGLEWWVLIIFAWKKQFWKFKRCSPRFWSQNCQKVAQRANFGQNLQRWPIFMLSERFSVPHPLLMTSWLFH